MSSAPAAGPSRRPPRDHYGSGAAPGRPDGDGSGNKRMTALPLEAMEMTPTRDAHGRGTGHARNRSPRRSPHHDANLGRGPAPATLRPPNDRQYLDNDDGSEGSEDSSDEHADFVAHRPNRRHRQVDPTPDGDAPRGAHRGGRKSPYARRPGSLSPAERGGRRITDEQRIIGMVTGLVLLCWLLLSNPPHPPNRAVDALRRLLSSRGPLSEPVRVTLRHHLFLPGDESKGVALVPGSLGLVWANQSVAGGLEWFDFESPDLIPSAAPAAVVGTSGGAGVNQTVTPSVRRTYPFGRVKWVAALPGAPFVVAWSSISSNLTLFQVPPTGRIVPRGPGFLLDEEDVKAICTGSVPIPGSVGRNSTVAVVQKGGFVKYFAVEISSGQFTPLRTVAIRLEPSEFITACSLSPLRPHMLDFSTTHGTLASINMTTAGTSSLPPRPILAPNQWDAVSFPGFPLPPPTSSAWPLPHPGHAEPSQPPSKSKIQSMLSFYSTDLGSEFLLLAHKSGTYTLLARTETLTSSGKLYKSGWWLVSRFVLAHVLADGASSPAPALEPPKHLAGSAMDVTTLPMGPRFPNGVWAVHVKHHPETRAPGYWLLPLEQLLGALDLRVLNNVSPLPPADVTVVGELPLVGGTSPLSCGCKSASHGVCVTADSDGALPARTVCECYQGFSGPDCAMPAATCHAPNATVVRPGTCACPPGWIGMHCDHVAVPANMTLVPQIRHAGDNDDAAIYVHPADARAAVALGTTKSHKQTGEGGVHVWLLQSGIEVGFVGVPNGAGVNSINVVYGVQVGGPPGQPDKGEKMDVVVASVRGSINGVAVWKIDPRALLVAANVTLSSDNSTGPASNATSPSVLTPLSSHILPLDPSTVQVYGSCAFSYSLGPTLHHAVVLPTKEGRAHQFHLTLQTNATHPTAAPVPKLSPVRSWRVGRGSQLENCQADPGEGILYVGEEGVGVWAHDLVAATGDAAGLAYGGKPGQFTWPPQTWAPHNKLEWPRLIDATVNAGVRGASLRMDVEGLGMYVTPRRKRKLLVVSSQGQNAFVVYDVTRVRSGATPRLVSVRITRNGVGAQGVDEVTKTDSLSVTNAAVGGFASGVLVVHDDATTEAGEVSKVSSEATFKVVDWEELARRVKEHLPDVDLLD